MGVGVLGTAMIEGVGDLPSRDRRVLAALALHAPDMVSRDRLADAVWGDDRPPSWAKVLQNAVSRLRKALGSDSIRSGPTGYRLDLPSDEVDVKRFERLLDVAERKRTSEPRLAERHLHDARLLWRGRPFADLEHWTGAAGAISRLESRKRVLDELGVEINLAMGRVDDAVAAAGALLEEEPFDERRGALLATSLYRAGRAVDALAVLRRVRRALGSELGLEPGPQLVALELAVLRHDPLLSGPTNHLLHIEPTPHRPSAPGNLPAPLSRLFGRDRELEQIAVLLDEERLVVLVGTGGVGKTRLALAAAEAASPSFSGGSWVVELADTDDPEDVAPLVTAAFGFVPRDGLTARQTVIEGIRDRHVLLVLDNCEHVLDAVLDLAIDLLRRCSRLRILATSRETFGVDGEHVVPVPPLPVESDSVELFIDRARNSGASVGSTDRAVIEQICRLVDGIPLAIELAAARARAMPLNDLALRLGERLDVLAVRRHGRFDRHRTMRATLDWSYDLLDHDERVAFARVSVFSGGFDLAAAEAVVTGAPLDGDVLEVLGRLVDKSMVIADTSRTPFRLLEPLRQYSADRLAAAGETADLARRHATYYADLTRQLTAHLEGPDEIEAAARLDAIRANLRTAFAMAVTFRDSDIALRIVAPLARYTTLHVWAEPWSWCQTALTLPGADTHVLRAATLLHASQGAWQLGDHANALTLADQAVAATQPGSTTWRDAQMARSTALLFLERVEEADAAATLGAEPLTDDADRSSLERTAVMLLTRNLAGHPDPALASDLLQRAEASSPSMLALALHTASVVSPDDQSLAVERNRRALDLARSTGAVLIEGFALAALAILEVAVGPAVRAARYVDVMARYLNVGNGAHLRGFGRGIIVPLVAAGAHEAAAVVDGATQTDTAVLHTLAEEIHAALERARGELGTSFRTAARRGDRMTDDELVNYLRDVVDALSA